MDLIGEPRLVRLNPNVPWKTRGNAALSARFGVGFGPRRQVGRTTEGPLYGYPRGRRLSTREAAAFSEAAWEVVRTLGRRGDANTDPAMVVSSRRLPAAVYRRAVGSVVEISEAHRWIAESAAVERHEGSDRGLIGAAAAIAWPGRRVTWELIAYRSAGREGMPREVDRSSVLRFARRQPSSFLCEDPRTRRLLVVPHTRCPILYGIRSSRRAGLLRAPREVESETVDRWILFRTNQGTGDHLRWGARDSIPPYSPGQAVGILTSGPVSTPGGHVRLELRTDRQTVLHAMVFEPSKTLPRVARSLMPGDRVRLWGGTGADSFLRVEGISIHSLVPRYQNGPRDCPACGGRLHSHGAGRGYRCRGCGGRFPPESRRGIRWPPTYGLGTYHPTPSARRHLHPRGPEGWAFAEASHPKSGL